MHGCCSVDRRRAVLFLGGGGEVPEIEGPEGGENWKRSAQQGCLLGRKLVPAACLRVPTRPFSGFCNRLPGWGIALHAARILRPLADLRERGLEIHRVWGKEGNGYASRRLAAGAGSICARVRLSESTVSSNCRMWTICSEEFRQCGGECLGGRVEIRCARRPSTRGLKE